MNNFRGVYPVNLPKIYINKAYDVILNGTPKNISPDL